MQNQPQIKSPDSKSKKALPVVILTVFIDLLGFTIVIPILAIILSLPGGSLILPGTAQSTRLILAGLLTAIYPFAQFFAAPVLGQLSDRFGRKPILAASLIGTLVSRIVFIFAIISATNGSLTPEINLAILFISRFIDGITGGNISVANSAIADITTPENRAKNFGLVGAAFGIGFILGPTMGAKLADANLIAGLANFLPKWIADANVFPLWIATIFCAINIVLMLNIFPETIKQKINKPLTPGVAVKNIFNAFTLGNLRVVFATIFLFTLGFTAVTQFFQTYYLNRFDSEITTRAQEKLAKNELALPQGLQYAPKEVQLQFAKQSVGRTEASDMFSYIGFWVVVAQGFLARPLGKRFKSSNLFKWGLLVNGIATILILIPDSSGWLLITLPLFALSNGLIQPNSSAIVSNSADAKSQGEVLGLNQSVQSLGQIFPPIVAGYIASLSLIQGPFLIGAICTLLAFVLFFMMYKEQKVQILTEE